MPQQFPRQGEVWEVDLEGGRNQRALAISTDKFNSGPAGKVIVLWITSVRMVQHFHIEVPPLESGLDGKIYIQCDEIQTVSRARFQGYVSTLSQPRMKEIEGRLRLLLS